MRKPGIQKYQATIIPLHGTFAERIASANKRLGTRETMMEQAVSSKNTKLANSIRRDIAELREWIALQEEQAQAA